MNFDDDKHFMKHCFCGDSFCGPPPDSDCDQENNMFSYYSLDDPNFWIVALNKEIKKFKKKRKKKAKKKT